MNSFNGLLDRMKKYFLLSTAAFLTLSSTFALADNNNFFGANAGGGSSSSSSSSTANPITKPDYSTEQPEDNNTNAALPGLNYTTPASQASKSTDFTVDEKRMQHKYKDNLAHAKSLVARGEAMMKQGGGNPNNKDFKKGKILKEIGEKSLADLKAVSPSATEQERFK